MYRIVICGLPGCTVFFHIVINGTIFGNKLPNTKCISLFSLELLSETVRILGNIERDMIKTYIYLHLNYPVFSDFNETCNISTYIRKVLISRFMQILPAGAESFDAHGRTVRQTDKRDEANSRFLQFCELS
jgi:hypothetical protein